ncbi:MAG: hypothetical protein J6A06_04865 [Fibrobacteraceae bacterium]|nr:hypothetical protein [Fibrobacteraceae bacterium]
MKKENNIRKKTAFLVKKSCFLKSRKEFFTTLMRPIVKKKDKYGLGII